MKQRYYPHFTEEKTELLKDKVCHLITLWTERRDLSSGEGSTWSGAEFAHKAENSRTGIWGSVGSWKQAEDRKWWLSPMLLLKAGTWIGSTIWEQSSGREHGELKGLPASWEHHRPNITCALVFQARFGDPCWARKGFCHVPSVTRGSDHH